jgi:hypothetical protein
LGGCSAWSTSGKGASEEERSNLGLLQLEEVCTWGPCGLRGRRREREDGKRRERGREKEGKRGSGGIIVRNEFKNNFEEK